MVGEESIRIIITHADVEAMKEGFDTNDVKRSVSRLAAVGMDHIAVVGLETTAEEIEHFIHSTLLPQPRQIELQIEQISRLAFRSQQARHLSKAIRQVHAKIDAAQQYCDDITTGDNRQRQKTYETDVKIMDIQQAVTAMVQQEKEQIFRGAAVANLCVDEQTICFAQAGPSLSIKLKRFVVQTNRFLSWNVTDPNDPRNTYRACNHCGAVYAKVDGCNGATTCGAISRTHDSKEVSKDYVTLFGVDFLMEGGNWRLSFRSINRAFRSWSSRNGVSSENVHRKRDGAIIESGCGQEIIWSSMRPVEPEVMAALGNVESVHVGTFEDLSGQRFHTEVRLQEEINKETLKRGFDEAKAEK
jgi:hypothetical protein